MQVRMLVAVATMTAQSALNEATVQGGGIPGTMTTTKPLTVANSVNGPEVGFGLQDFDMSVNGHDGHTDVQAGDHPYDVTTVFDLNTVFEKRPNGGYEPAQQARAIVVDLPPGFIGNALVTPTRCLQYQMQRNECPAKSQVGWAVLNGGPYPGENADRERYPIYNTVPERGFPAEFGIVGPEHGEIMLYASIVRTVRGYDIRIASPGIINDMLGGEAGVSQVAVTFFGNPAASHGEEGGQAFLTNPMGCSSQPQRAAIEAESWHEPGRWSPPLETVVYPSISGCRLLTGAAGFSPSFKLQPDETHADTPSGYEVDLKVPQAPNMFEQLATPDLRNAMVTLPQGVSLSPSAASGPNALIGCAAEGPEGINIGSNDSGPGGQDLGDPEATELGEGHAGPGGNNSPYDDGLWHTAPGHCPQKSQIGTVEVKTPLLEEPLKGHVYVAQPGCGGADQPECTAEDVTDGKLYGIYLEVSGSGVIIKLKGEVHVNPSTGQITTTFKENPQFPFEELKMTLDGGQRAALANPQTCGMFTTTSDLEPWSAPESGPNATPSSQFEVAGCKSPMPFGPSFEAGAVKPLGGEFSPFTMTLKRNDGEQNLGGVSVTLPPGLAGMISRVPLCDEAQANAGTCPEFSRIGTAHVAAGSGSEPLWLEGRVYLTGRYKNDPFGLSIVVPAVAGPYNLGNEVVRAAISVDPKTAQVTVASSPIPLMRDGVPFRLKEINVTVDRPGFVFNPTNCSQLHVTGSVSGDMPDGSKGSTMPVSSPFAVTGCKNLPFKPGFSVLTHAGHTRKNGEYLHVVVKSGAGQANIAKVHVALPKQLPSRVSTLNLACTEAQFAANPAGCPSGSKVGTATAYTPVLPVPLTGPAIFVSHGGAKFPDLDIVLQGDGVTVDLTGNTFISKGITTSTFASVPDVPVKRFDLILPTGPHSALGGNGNLCYRTVTRRVKTKVNGKTIYRKRHMKKRLTLTMPTTITGQNGKVVKQNTKLAVQGCSKAKPKAHKSRRRHHSHKK